MNDSIKARCICWTDGLWKDEKPKLVILSVSVLIIAVIFVKLKLFLYWLARKQNWIWAVLLLKTKYICSYLTRTMIIRTHYHARPVLFLEFSGNDNVPPGSTLVFLSDDIISYVKWEKKSIRVLRERNLFKILIRIFAAPDTHTHTHTDTLSPSWFMWSLYVNRNEKEKWFQLFENLSSWLF